MAIELTGEKLNHREHWGGTEDTGESVCCELGGLTVQLFGGGQSTIFVKTGIEFCLETGMVQTGVATMFLGDDLRRGTSVTTSGDDMQNWKRAVIAGSVGAATMLLLKGKRPAAVLVGGVGLAVLASEYPNQFVRIREELPSYVRQGTKFLDLAMKFGSRIEELVENRAAQAFEELGEY